MAALRGIMNYGHHAGSVSRLAHTSISAELSTWDTHASTTIDKYGRVLVSITRNGKSIHEFCYDTPEISVKEMEKDIAKRVRREGD